MIFRTLFCLIALLAWVSSASAALVFQYNATLDPGSHTVWQPNVNTSGVTRNFTLGGASYIANAGSSLPGITSAFQFTGATGSGGLTTGSFGGSQFPLGGNATNATGASATFEMWVRPDLTSWDALATNQVLLETGGGVNGFELMLVPEVGGAILRFITRNSNTNNVVNYFLSNDLLLREFIQVAGVVDPAGGSEKMRLYVNGSQVGANANYRNWQAGTNDAGIARVDSNHPAGTPGQNNFDGQVALFNIYDGALTDEEVRQVYVSVSAVPEPGSMFVMSGLAMCLAGVVSRRRR